MRVERVTVKREVLRGWVLPVEDIPGDDTVGGAEPGAELGEEHVGAHGQQQRLLLDETFTTPTEIERHRERERSRTKRERDLSETK